MNEYKGVKNTYIKQRDIKTLSKIHIFNIKNDDNATKCLLCKIIKIAR